MRLLNRAASSTSQAMISERAELGDTTKTTASAQLIKIAEALLPILATGDAVALDEALKAANVKRRIEPVGYIEKAPGRSIVRVASYPGGHPQGATLPQSVKRSATFSLSVQC